MTYNTATAAAKSLRDAAFDRAHKQPPPKPTTLCSQCGRPPVTRPSYDWPDGRPMEGAQRCEVCPPREPEPVPQLSPARAAVLQALRDGYTTSPEIARELSRAQPSVGRDLRILEKAGLARVVGRWDGALQWRAT